MLRNLGNEEKKKEGNAKPGVNSISEHFLEIVHNGLLLRNYYPNNSAKSEQSTNYVLQMHKLDYRLVRFIYLGCYSYTY